MIRTRIPHISLPSKIIGIYLFASAFENALSNEHQLSTTEGNPNNAQPITLFMAGDVMLGRGIDQVLPYPSDPILYESYMRSAIGYVELAEQKNGRIPNPVSCNYIWGYALDELARMTPDLRLINLETSITQSDEYWKNKGINYRMHPNNISCLTEANIDYCSLANNHVLDWGYSGLTETIETLKGANISIAGAGENLQEAEVPAILPIKGKGRVIVFSYGHESSGIPFDWGAKQDKPGVNLLHDLSLQSVLAIKNQVQAIKQPRDIVVISMHWGGNWGYKVPEEQIEFAHQLIDQANVNIVHGHSSHHAKGLEIYKDKPIIYGSGDFLNDYEGISGNESFRDDLALMYFVSMNPTTGKLIRFQMTPTQIKNFRLNKISKTDAVWVSQTLERESKKFGTRFILNNDNTLTVHWK